MEGFMGWEAEGDLGVEGARGGSRRRGWGTGRG